jgi:ankyrin repeat protein
MPSVSRSAIVVAVILLLLLVMFALMILGPNVRVRFSQSQQLVGPESELYFSIVRGEPRGVIEQLIERDASDLHDFYFIGQSLLAHAIRYGRNDVIDLLIEHGANPNGLGRVGESTPLFIAVIYDDEVAARLLMSHGADPNMTAPGFGMSPYDYAIDNDLYTFVQLFRAEVGNRYRPQ